MSDKKPSLQFYPGDWRKDPGVQSLSYHDRGVWFEMLLLMHESTERGVLLLNGRPMPESALARLLGLDNQNLTTTLTTLLDFGVASKRDQDGAIYCRRMVRDENLSKIRKAAGKMGGNPNLVNQNPTTQVNQNPTTQVNQNPTPSSSSSSSDSSIKRPPKSPKGDGYTEDFLQFWNAYPNKQKKGDTFKAWKKLKPSQELVAEILSAVEKAKVSREWQKNNGEFIPHPSSWLNGRRWEDQPVVAPTPIRRVVV